MKFNRIWYIGALIIGFLVLSVLLTIGWLRNEIDRTEFTESTIEENVIIGDDALIIPQNYFRFSAQRKSTVLKQVNLAMAWPDAVGYNQDNKDQFRNGQNLILITLKKRELALDMNNRFAPIYKKLLGDTSSKGPNGLTLHKFKKNVGYNGEQLALWQGNSQIWVARCYAGKNSVKSTCMHDMNMGKDLVSIYRFNSDLLPQWREIHNLVAEKINGMIAQ